MLQKIRSSSMKRTSWEPLYYLYSQDEFLENFNQKCAICSQELGLRRWHCLECAEESYDLCLDCFRSLNVDRLHTDQHQMVLLISSRIPQDDDYDDEIEQAVEIYDGEEHYWEPQKISTQSQIQIEFMQGCSNCGKTL